MDGFRVNDKELRREFLYFIMAQKFHFSPEVVDRMDGYRVEAFMEMLDRQEKQKEN